MTTKKFNLLRASEWSAGLSRSEARIFLMVGVKQSGEVSFYADPSLPPLKIAAQLDELARNIRLKNKIIS